MKKMKHRHILFADKCGKSLIGLLAILFAVFIMWLCFPAQKQNTAQALQSTSGAVKVGNGAELWNAADGDFDSDVLEDLMDKLFGKEDPVAYVKANGADDYNKYKQADAPYYVVPAVTINSNPQINNADNGLVVTLGGKEWMAASLTLADIEDMKDNVILTLWLADYSGTAEYFSDASPAKGNNMYSRSDIRNHLLTNANWSLYNTLGDDSFAEQFLVQPKYITYHQKESQIGRNQPINGNIHMPNEALIAPTSNWSVASYSDSDTYDGKKYGDWGNDFIWLPSVTETGSDNFVNNNSSIWCLSKTQLCYNSSYGWLRTGLPNRYDCSLPIMSGGGCSGTYVNQAFGVRPAIHFNLSSAALGAAGVKLKDPANATTTYNGDPQTIGSIYAANKNLVSWYAPKWYENANNYIAQTYYNTANSSVGLTGAKDAGEYWVKVEITQKWIDDTNASIDAAGAENGWNAAEIAAAKERRRPKFKGNSNTSDSAHIESDQIRWCKITVNPKEITVNKPSYNASTGVFTAPSFANDSEFYDSNHPVLATHFTGTAADGTKYDAIDVMPNKRCTTPYTAQAILVSSASDKTEYKGNYVIKDAFNMTCTIQINRGRIAIVGVAESSKAYTGEKLTFALSGYSVAWTDVASLILPAGLTLEGNDADGWFLSATDAGEYEVTASIKSGKTTDWCWNTSNFAEEIIADRTFIVTITRKTLLVDFTTSSGAFLLQSGANVTFGAAPSNALAGDEVKLTLEYFSAERPDIRIPVPSGTLDASTLNPGTYYLAATLEDSAASGNKNYKLDGGEARQEITVSFKNITIDSVNWQYSQNNGVPTAIASGAGAAASAPFTATYNGSAYVFALNTTGLADAGVKIDASYGANGYLNGSQTNATDNAVAVTVRLMPLEAGWAFNDASGKPQENQYKDFTIYVKINKADVDFSGVVWSAEELEFNAVSQQVTIKSGFPSFLTPVYGHASPSTSVGDYVTRVNGVTVKDANAAKNYNIPTSTQLLATAELAHNWKIVKKRIEVTWTTAQQTDTGGTVIFVPTVSDNSAGAIIYTYYNNARDKEMTLDEIFAEYSQVTTQTYWVCAKLKPASASGTAFNETNCVLIEGGTDVSATGSFQSFTTGENKTPVQVGIVTNKVVYNKKEQPAEVTFSGGNLKEGDFTVSYKVKNASGGFEAFAQIPTNAGEYRVVIALDNGQTGQYAITGQCEFDYEIEKASYDVSAMKWVDTEHGNAEYTEAYVYAYGVTHTLSFVGENIDGLTVNYTPDTEGNLQGGDAKDYKVTVTFTVNDPLNYKVPDDIEFTWSILPYTPDLSGVTWNYNTESPFVFKMESGEAVKYRVYLNGLPEGMEDLIEYGDDTGEYSDAGAHITSFTVKENDPIRKNYGDLVFGGGLDKRLVWEIKPLLVEKPVQKQTKTFRAEGYTFAEITNLPEDFAEYFDVEILDSEKNPLAQTDGSWLFKDVDRYQIKIQFKQGMNGAHGGDADNVKWSDNGRIDYSVVLTVEKLVLEVKGWTDDPEGYAKPTLNTESAAEVEKYFDYVLINKETGENVGLNEQLAYETSYTIALKLKPEFAGNVAVKYLGHEVEETTPYGFLTGVDPLADDPENFYRKPTDKELHIEYKYTGEEIAFKLGDWFVPEKMQILSGVLAGTDEGVYQVRVGFKRGANSAWGTAENFDRNPVTVEFVISQNAKISDKFILTESAAANHPYKFLYGDFTEEPNVEDYAYDTDKPLYMARLALGDTLVDLLAQFANGADIKVYDAKGEITDFTKVLATGMMLRLMDGETVLNQLTISVLGDVNNDGRITVQDKGLLNLQLLGKRSFTGAELISCDINSDGRITVQDKGLLNLQLLGKRDIYDGLSVKAAAKAVRAEVTQIQAAEQRIETEKTEPAVSSKGAPLSKGSWLRKQTEGIAHQGEKRANNPHTAYGGAPLTKGSQSRRHIQKGGVDFSGALKAPPFLKGSQSQRYI